MGRFDWEPRPVPEGYTQILRNQRREALNQDLQAGIQAFRDSRLRAQWERTSATKAALVGSLLAAEPSAGGEEAEPLQPRPLVSDVLKSELQEKEAKRGSEIAAAKSRHAAQLQQARQVAAARETRRAQLAEEQQTKAWERDSAELKDCVTRVRARQLVGIWGEQEKDRETAAAVESSSALSGILLDQWPATDVNKIESMRRELVADLDAQLEEGDRRKEAEAREAALLLHKLEMAWQEAHNAAVAVQEAVRRRQAEFVQGMGRICGWRAALAAKEAALKAEEERQLVEEAQRQVQEAAADLAAAKVKNRADMEAQLDEREELLARRREEELRFEEALVRQAAAQESKRDAEAAAKMEALRQRDADIMGANGALLERNNAKRDAFRSEKMVERSEMERVAAAEQKMQSAARAARSQEQARCHADFQAQVAAKELIRAGDALVAREREAVARREEERRRQHVARAMAALEKKPC